MESETLDLGKARVGGTLPAWARSNEDSGVENASASSAEIDFFTEEASDIMSEQQNVEEEEYNERVEGGSDSLKEEQQEELK